MEIEKKKTKKNYNRQTCQIRYKQISISQVPLLCAKSVCLRYG